MTPLDQLRPLHIPPPPGWWPPAPGWWLLGVMLIVLLAWLGARLYQRHQRHRYRRAALDQLALLKECELNHYLNLVRRSVKTGCPQSHWASKDNSALLAALDTWSGGNLALDLSRIDKTPQSVALAQYQPHYSGLSASEAAILAKHIQQWIKRHKTAELLPAGEAPPC